ncbi:LysR family transcriptional regulator [Alginatibacterium sediminis]|uniref:LysR family transcriptional regulator n=1 Tax=Alginatibacterium sediminis TaxID=2164068 RepID=A0A420EG62_9ALTE|nr:LysR family transcriptional regulator [Alginatibacterium sediminis]RKF19695.1 LysR family transcriptional regulator [Alginatibacterium sediminis]
MDLNNLPVFVAIYTTGSTQKAARFLNRSQSYVSKSLARLREELQDPLFVRTAAGMEPTSYSHDIAPKLRKALMNLNQTLLPHDFSPKELEKISIHISQPILHRFAKPLILAIKQQTDAVIELRQWQTKSEQELLDGVVDIGFHAITDRPQTLYQRSLGQVYGVMAGNAKAALMKTEVIGFNEHHAIYSQFEPDVQAALIIDDMTLRDQLLEHYRCYLVSTKQVPTNDYEMKIHLGYVVRSSRRAEAKIQWLIELCSTVFNQHFENDNQANR